MLCTATSERATSAGPSALLPSARRAGRQPVPQAQPGPPFRHPDPPHLVRLVLEAVVVQDLVDAGAVGLLPGVDRLTGLAGLPGLGVAQHLLLAAGRA